MANHLEGCLNCGEELHNLPGKRKKLYCNSTCRSNHWQKIDRLQKKNVDKAPVVTKTVVTPVATTKSIMTATPQEAVSLAAQIDYHQKALNSLSSDATMMRNFHTKKLKELRRKA